MKQAILVISFGTSHAQTRAKTLTCIEQTLADAFPERKLYTAWTSSFLRKKVFRTTGEQIDSVDEAMQRMRDEGIEDVLVQTTQLLQGIEYEAMTEAIRSFADTFASVRIGLPLLADAAERRELAAELIRTLDLSGEDALVWMGHGTAHRANAVYAELDSVFREVNGGRAFLGTVEGDFDLDTLIETVKASAPKKVYLAPFLMVAGEHAVSDMAGDDPDSWKRRFESAGMETECILKGLGEYETVRRLLVLHAEHACP